MSKKLWLAETTETVFVIECLRSIFLDGIERWLPMKDYDNRITDNDIQLAWEITRATLGRCESPPVPIPVGSVNKVFRVICDGQPSILRFSDQPNTYADYRKELWCTDQARALGVPTPEIGQMGQHGTAVYMFQRFVEGVSGIDPSLDAQLVWSALGAHLAAVHTIPTQGFGLRLKDASIGQFDESWERHLSYNLSALGPSDPLQIQGHLSRSESALLAECFALLERSELRFGLCHGDVSLRNVIVDSTATVHLLDWGCGHSHVVPYSDFANILRWERPTRTEFTAFLSAYGISLSQFDQMQPLLVAITLLNAVDKFRWALHHNHASLGRYLAGVRWALAIASGEEGDWFTNLYTEVYGLAQ